MHSTDDHDRDQAVRVALGISTTTAAKMARVNRGTIVRYEISPNAIASPELRKRCAAVYAELRALLRRHPLTDAAS